MVPEVEEALEEVSGSVWINAVLPGRCGPRRAGLYTTLIVPGREAEINESDQVRP